MLIVTHFHPDIDAICSVWLFRKFGEDKYKSADIAFVPAGNTYNNKEVDSNNEVVHVDTGMGKFDHHQLSDKNVCASSLVFDFIKKRLSTADRQALKRLVNVVCEIDHFKECFWPEAESDRYQFMLMDILRGLKLDNELDDHGMVDFGSVCLTGIFQSMKAKQRAEDQIEKGIKSSTFWGKTLFLKSGENEAVHLAQKQGYNMVVRKDPANGMLKIALRPDSRWNLKKLYHRLKKEDPKATWFYHISGNMLLNGSRKNPNMKPTFLSLTKLIEIVKSFSL